MKESSKLKIIAATMFTIATLCNSCSNEILQTEPDLTLPQRTVTDITRPVSGAQKMENPYTIENMTEAFNNLSPQTRGDLDVDDVVENTHSHIRITFRTDEEYYVAQTLGLNMFYSPLDVVFEYGGYVENEGNADGTDVRYCVASAAQLEAIDESGAEYIVLDTMFMPDEEEGYETRGITTRSGTTLTPDFIERLIESAYTLKGYEEYLSGDEYSESAPETRAITPRGRFTYTDTPLRNGVSVGTLTIGMQGMEIKATRLLKTAHGYTDVNGYYTCDKSFKNPWKYETSFERWEFAIRNGVSGAKSFSSGKTEKVPWDLDFDGLNNNNNHFHATIFRAAHHYYYQDIQGLSRPPENGVFKTQMKIAAMYEYSTYPGVTVMGKRFLGIGNPIKIYNPFNMPADIYATTIHELAHAVHWKISKSEYKKDTAEANRLSETWSTGVQYALTRMKYPTYRGKEFILPNYTNLIKDLMDTQADYHKDYDYNIAEGDNVHGYTIKQVEECLIGTSTWSQFRQKIYNKAPANPTRGNLQTLFDAWGLRL